MSIFGRSLPPTPEEQYAAEQAAKPKNGKARRAAVSEARSARADVRAEQATTPGRKRRAEQQAGRHLERRDALLAEAEAQQERENKKAQQKKKAAKKKKSGWW